MAVTKRTTTRSSKSPLQTHPIKNKVRLNATKKGASEKAFKFGPGVRPDFSHSTIVQRVMDVRGIISIGKVADSFGMSKKQIALTAGLSTHVLYRPARLGSLRTQERVREMLEIVSRVSEWAGGGEHAMAWYRAQPISAFGGRTAEALVKEGKAATVRDYLDHIATGGFA